MSAGGGGTTAQILTPSGQIQQVQLAPATAAAAAAAGVPVSGGAWNSPSTSTGQGTAQTQTTNELSNAAQQSQQVSRESD